MQVLATGKWSKAEKMWKMVVALRRPVEGSKDGTPSGPRAGGRRGARRGNSRQN